MTLRVDPPLSVDGFVLAGGKSTRMGRDKAPLEFDGVPLVERALRNLREITGAPRILGNRPDLAHFAPVVSDIYPHAGPLGGIHAGLTAAAREWSVFLPVDVPLLPVGFLRYLVDRVSLTQALATIPIVAGRHQPLVALYHRSLLPTIAGRLESGDLGTLRAIIEAANAAGGRNGIDEFRVELLVASGHLESAETDSPSYRWFQNMNTPSELEGRAS
jgi:molybdenum cofactor guanylyltransferase